MTVCDLLAYLVLVLFITFMGWHHWLIIRRQHALLVDLTRLVAIKTSGPEVAQHVANEQSIVQQRIAATNPPAPPPDFAS